jgi:hypothetical protein
MMGLPGFQVDSSIEYYQKEFKIPVNYVLRSQYIPGSLVEGKKGMAIFTRCRLTSTTVPSSVQILGNT